MTYRFLEPLDVLFLRGNKLFGDPGSFGESLVPPWPSVAAGALRSRMLVDDGIDLTAFARGKVNHSTLGTPEQPGTFAITAFHLARRSSKGAVEILVQPPADLVMFEDEDGKACVHSLAPVDLTPTPPPLEKKPGIRANFASSYPLPLLPVLAQSERGKPAGGFWLTEAGWRAYLAGKPLQSEHLVKSSALWCIDHRVGVGLDAATGRAADGRLFSVQAVSMVKRGHHIGKDKDTHKPIHADYDVGFLAAVTGAEPPNSGSIRLGGDGRAVAIHPAQLSLPEPDYSAAIAKDRRCRLVLTTPGLFPQGWRLPGMDESGLLHFDNIRARVVSAAVSRFEVVSGWDLAKWQPKTAQRACPAGSVYWLDQLEATPEDLRKLAERGLWSDSWDDPQRRAEGFNRFVFAAY